MSLDAARFERNTKRTRKRAFRDEMNLVVPWTELVSLITAYTPKPGSNMEEALYDTPMFREFAGLDAGEDNLPDESTILRFHHLFEAKEMNVQILATVNATLTAKGLLLKQGTVVDATLIVHIRHMANLPTQYLRRPRACDLWTRFAMNPVQQPATAPQRRLPPVLMRKPPKRSPAPCRASAL